NHATQQQTQRKAHKKHPHHRHQEKKTHDPDILKAPKKLGPLGKLPRLPQRQAGNHDPPADRHDAEIEHFLHGVVMREIVMAQTKPQRLAHRHEHLARGNRKQLLPKPVADDAVTEESDAIEHKNPHAEEMPLQSVLRPFADHDGIGKPQKAEQNVVVIDLPAAADHYENGDSID